MGEHFSATGQDHAIYYFRALTCCPLGTGPVLVAIRTLGRLTAIKASGVSGDADFAASAVPAGAAVNIGGAAYVAVVTSA